MACTIGRTPRPRLRDAGARRADHRKSPSRVWRSTSLSRSRLTSAIELYGARPRRSSAASRSTSPNTVHAGQTWHGSGCAWDVFDEVVDSAPRRRRCCTPSAACATRRAASWAPSSCTSLATIGRCPSLASANPYADVLGAPEPPAGPAPTRRSAAWSSTAGASIRWSPRATWRGPSRRHRSSALSIARAVLADARGRAAGRTTCYFSNEPGSASTRSAIPWRRSSNT